MMTPEKNTGKRGRKSEKSAALHKRLTDDLHNGIYTGRLPGVTLLAEKYDSSPATIQRTLQRLEADGLVEIRPRSGTYVRNSQEVCFIAFSEDSAWQSKAATPPLGFIAEYEALYNGIYATLGEAGATLTFRTVNIDDPDSRRFPVSETSRFIVLIPQMFQDIAYEMLPPDRWLRVMGAQDYNCPAGHITYDNFCIGQYAAEHLIEQGCREFCFVGSVRQQIFRQRFDSFTEVLQRRGSDTMHLNVDIRTMTLSQMSEIMHNFLSTHTEALRDGSLGIFCTADHFVIPLRQELAGFGLPPATVKLVSCDNNPYYLRGVYPRPAEIDICMYDIGVQAARQILEGRLAERNKIAIRPRRLPPEA